MVVKTLDVGGAGPVSALLIASRMVQHEGEQQQDLQDLDP
jgi:hypothetical protein